MKQNSKVIGLTGGIGCGKSTVSDYLKDKGYFVIDADRIARNLTTEKPVIKAIATAFGKKVLISDTELNRAELAKIVFSDKVKLRELEAITHPIVIKRIKKQIAEAKARAEQLIFLDAPLLFEVHLDELCDKNWLITLSEDVQIARIQQRGGIDIKQIKQRIAAQMSTEEKIKRSDIVINNDGTLAELYVKIECVLRELSKKERKNLFLDKNY